MQSTSRAEWIFDVYRSLLVDLEVWLYNELVVDSESYTARFVRLGLDDEQPAECVKLEVVVDMTSVKILEAPPKQRCTSEC